MDAIATDLAQYLVNRLENLPPHRRLLVGIAGIPASGKSTLAARVVAHANKVLAQPASASSIRVDAGIDGPGTVLRALDRLRTFGAAHAVLVGLDGWHLTRAQLDTLPDPALAHARRGAHWTFDGRAYADFVRLLRQEVAVPHSTVRASWHRDEEGGMSTTLSAPSFDHALKDPSPSTVTIQPHDRIVVIEGLYAFLGLEPWVEAGKLLDERWLVEVDEAEARKRLVKRHVLTGVAKDLEEAYRRADENDMPNGRFVIEQSLEPTRRIISVDDPVLSTT